MCHVQLTPPHQALVLHNELCSPVPAWLAGHWHPFGPWPLPFVPYLRGLTCRTLCRSPWGEIWCAIADMVASSQCGVYELLRHICCRELTTAMKYAQIICTPVVRLQHQEASNMDGSCAAIKMAALLGCDMLLIGVQRD